MSRSSGPASLRCGWPRRSAWRPWRRCAPPASGRPIRLEVRLPEGGIDGSRFVIDEVLESFELKADGSPRLAGEPKEDLSCLQDAACFDNSALGNMDLYKRAVARLHFVNGRQGFL